MVRMVGHRYDAVDQISPKMGTGPRDTSGVPVYAGALCLVDPLSLLPWISSLFEGPQCSARAGHPDPTRIGKGISNQSEERAVNSGSDGVVRSELRLRKLTTN